MTLPSYDQVLDITDRFAETLRQSRKKRAAQPSEKTAAVPDGSAAKKRSVADVLPRTPSSKDAVFIETMKRFDNIVGRFDSLEKVPHRELRAPEAEDEAEHLREHGAVLREDGQWIVPDNVPLGEHFEPFYPDVPEDLRDRTPRLLTTRNGRSVASYVLPEDRAKGADSTATSLMYGGIVLVAALCYLASAIWAPLGVLMLLGFIPFTIALAQGEGPLEAAKSLVLLGLAPLSLASGFSMLAAKQAKSQIPSQFTNQVSNMSPETMDVMGIGGGISFLLLAMVAAFLFTLFDKNAQDGVIGSTFQKFKAIVKWAIVIGAAYYAVSFLPKQMQPFFFLALPALYPMIYTNANYIRRAKYLKEHGERFNLGRVGRLTDVHVKPKQMQAIKAFQDKSPLMEIGTSTGWLTKKHFPYAPDAGVRMCVSAYDLYMHMLAFGNTGMGKSTCVARPMAKQWVESRVGGFLCLDGKGSLPGELSSLIDVMIKPGVDFAPFQGLDGHGISTALNSTARAGGGGNPAHQVWELGADDYVVRCNLLFEALHKHEKAYIQHAFDMTRLKQLDIDSGIVEIARLERRGEDTGTARARLEQDRADYANWAVIRDGSRKWLWNVDTLSKVINMVNSPVKGAQGWEAGPLLAAAVQFLGYEKDPAQAAKRRANQPATIHPEIGKQSLLDDALEFVLHTWPSYEPQQRSSFFLNVNQRVLPITNGPYLVGKDGKHWKTLETGVDAGACLYGKAVGVDLPEERHQRAGVLIAALVKQRIYNTVALRGGNPDWEKEGQTPMMVMMDECQDLITDAERNLLPKCRSLKMAVVALTQNWEGLENKLGNEMKALQFCLTFQNYVLMRSSPKTYRFFEDRLGTAQMLAYEEPTVGLDMHGGVMALQASPLNDPNHPNRSAMRQMERQGAGRLVVQTHAGAAGQGWQGHALRNIDDSTLTKHIVVPQGGKLKMQPIFLPEEYSALTTFGQAIVILNRAGERRIDVATLNPIGADELRKVA
ncbi:hypothetical protein [Arenimonas sp. MALMAid1274]|uniref:hypothetical protein n=1 Tax=Arenimonas sp. MALMAid1274 TaxID=3411630 RepID=UPI003BA1C70F